MTCHVRPQKSGDVENSSEDWLLAGLQYKCKCARTQDGHRSDSALERKRDRATPFGSQQFATHLYLTLKDHGRKKKFPNMLGRFIPASTTLYCRDCR